jgi:hypothetical protein
VGEGDESNRQGRQPPVATRLGSGGPSGPPRGYYTIRIAAVLFLLSAIVELVSIATPVPWFGALRGGAPLYLYHLSFAAVFAAMGAGLWTATRWGYRMVFAGTAIYSLDRIRHLFDRPGRAAEILYQLRHFPELTGALDMNVLLDMSAVMTGTFVLCWLGFAGYIYVRREYFDGEVRSEK